MTTTSIPSTAVTAPAWDKDLLRELTKQLQEKRSGTPTATASPAAVKDEPIVISYGDGELKFSEVFGFMPPSGIDHAVRRFKAEDWNERVRQFIPVIDAGYIFPKQETEEAVVALMQGDNTLVYGPKGSGKSDLGQQLAARMVIPWIRINGRADMESSAIFGGVTVQEGSMHWVPGPAEELGTFGGLLQLDEPSAVPAGINMACQWMLESKDKRRIYLADKPATSGEKYIVPHDWFRVIATDNTQLQGDTTGRYAGTQPQNEAMLDRFGTVIKLDYMKKEVEIEAMLSRVPGLDKKEANRMVDFANHVRNDYDKGNIGFNMSLRGLISWSQKAVYWKDIKRSARLVFLNKLVESDRKVVEEVFFKMFGK